MYIAKIRGDFPALKNYVWFQNGGVSITPAPVAEAHVRLMRILTPESPTLSAALVSFAMGGRDAMSLRDSLRERWNIIIKGVASPHNCNRVSVPFFILEEEVDLLLEKLRVLAGEGDPRRGQGIGN